uniref:Uncharacterized protein n=1 Tax=Chromera velia CCMP2878 TaxID=1169474 RepID=A0A0G4G175_9ALVE|eukprot:Cvel_19657.t1-p1 / transcript=Cvel_19657.t1 / gene=Cvel_19657 / organism=Chromera_velia_CCMP2878 / gene_product=hypothetical protein / transcript_product=hypothetical protein / location=Cvel_scaffold1713:30818-31069(-) / protein_length=84 / sequence_SO=supercontig / SO=protein_coding / is_pseudo=false
MKLGKDKELFVLDMYAIPRSGPFLGFWCPIPGCVASLKSLGDSELLRIHWIHTANTGSSGGGGGGGRGNRGGRGGGWGGHGAGG